MSNDPVFAPGVRQELGAHLFTTEEIVGFARQFDPQRFHIDPEAAKDSVFGGLCASGWHTASVWMKLNVAAWAAEVRRAEAEGRLLPEFGPSPGFRNLKWLKPVFAGDMISYSQTLKGIRPVTSRPGWSILETLAEARNQHNELVMSFESAVLVKLPDTAQAG